MPGGRRRTASYATDSRHVESSGTWNSPPTRERSAELSVHEAQPKCQAVGDARMDRQSGGSHPTILEIRLSPVAACCFPTATKSRRGVLLSHRDQVRSRRVAFPPRPSPVAACCFPTATKSRRGVLLRRSLPPIREHDQVPTRRVALPSMAKSRRGVLLSNDDQAPSRRVAFQRRPSPVAACCFPTTTKSRRGVLLRAVGGPV